MIDDLPPLASASEPVLDGDESPSPDDLLVFDLACGQCGLPASIVDEVVPMPRITPLPGANPIVRGLFQLRGELVVAIDLSRLLGWAPWKGGTSSRILVVRAGKTATGLLTERVQGIQKPAGPATAPEGSELPSPLCELVHLRNGRPVYRLDLGALRSEIEFRMARTS